MSEMWPTTARMNFWGEPAVVPAYIHHGHGPHVPNHVAQPLYAQNPQSQPNSRLASDAVAYLRRSFGRDPKPSTATKRQIAIELGVDLQKINNWFQNERAKTKGLARIDAQRRANEGESAEENDGTTPPSSSQSPALDQVGVTATSSRPAPILTHLPSSTATEHTHLQALDLHSQAQAMQFQVPPQHAMVPMSAPAHLTSFPQAQLMQNWVDPRQITPTNFSMPQTTPGFQTTEATLTETPFIFTDIPTADLEWQSQFATPLSAGFDFDNTLNFFGDVDTPLHSARIDGAFAFSSPQDEHTFIAEPNSWTFAPQLSPSESYHEQSVVSESLPMTPASFGPEPAQNDSQFKDSLMSFGVTLPLEMATTVSPAAIFAKPATAVDVDLAPPRPASTQPTASFTKKRNIDIPALSIHHNSSTDSPTKSTTLQNNKLRCAKSMGYLRAPGRSILHPTRDDTRRVSKSPSHIRPSLTPNGSMPRITFPTTLTSGDMMSSTTMF